MFKLIFVALTSLSLAACLAEEEAGSSSDDGSQTQNVEVKSGYFIDSVVGNIKYKTETQSGTTSSEGLFKYKEGETVTFSVGDISLPAATAKPQITPVDMVSGGTVDSEEVVNIARLLQTLDSDGDASNGISIEDSAHTSASGYSLDFSQSTADFGSSASVSNYIAAAAAVGSSSETLETAANAKTHLTASVNALDDYVVADLILKTSEKTYQWGGIRVKKSGSFGSQAQTLNIAFPSDIGSSSKLVINADGTGTVWGENPITWEVNSEGQMTYTETDSHGDKWTVVMTKIGPLSGGENLLVKVDSPVGQEDFSRGTYLATMSVIEPEAIEVVAEK